MNEMALRDFILENNLEDVNPRNLTEEEIEKALTNIEKHLSIPDQLKRALHACLSGEFDNIPDPVIRNYLKIRFKPLKRWW
jgi:methionine synthase II (cobalamin-independent)